MAAFLDSFWIKLWIFIAFLLLMYDGLFIVLRERTLDHGDLSNIWYVYKEYSNVDFFYQDMQSKLIKTRGILEIVEASIYLVCFVLLISRMRVSYQLFGSMLTVVVLSFTFWKQLYYILITFEEVDQRNLVEDLILVYSLPNFIWLIISLVCLKVVASNVMKNLLLNQQVIPQ